MSVLNKIFAAKHEEVAAAKQGFVAVAELKAVVAETEAPRGFRLALQSSGKPLSLVAEVKKASPSKGLIRPDFDPRLVAEAYERAGATALSVLTDVQFFQGSPENLRIAKAATSLPCLRKDFVDDPYQVYEARAWGADAVLLILASLSSVQASELQSLIWSLGMDALVEVHTVQEAEVALSIGANLIGVNNRNLADFKTDLAYSEEILPLIRDHAVTVSESALETYSDLERVRAVGARAVLIGTTFCASPDIESRVKEVVVGDGKWSGAFGLMAGNNPPPRTELGTYRRRCRGGRRLRLVSVPRPASSSRCRRARASSWGDRELLWQGHDRPTR